MVLLSTSTHICFLGTFMVIWNHGSSNEDILGPLVHVLKLWGSNLENWRPKSMTGQSRKLKGAW